MNQIFNKKSFAIVVMLLFAVIGRAQSISVYISDSNGPFTNVRNSPNKGKIVDKIPVGCSAMLEVEKATGGWWRIVGDCYDGFSQDGEGDIKEVELKGSTTGYWIHYSVIAVGTRNYGGQKLYLRKEPNATAPITYTIKTEMDVRPMEIKGSWVKVKTLDGKGTGWIEAEWLCGNPLTNCC